MAETIRIGFDSLAKWHWWQIKDDLCEQGGLKPTDILIDPTATRSHFIYGTYKDLPFTCSWEKDRYFMLSMPKYTQVLVDAFADVLEYEPFCVYEHKQGMCTVEWDKIEPNARYKELQNDNNITNLSAGDIKQRKG